MKAIVKKFKHFIFTLIFILLIIIVGAFYFRHKIVNTFGGTTTADYSLVLKQFNQQVKLNVDEAKTITTRNQKFTNNSLKDWPKWTEGITQLFIGRDLVVKFPVKTEFKIDLKNVQKKDIEIKNHTLTFKKPLTIEVDSQRDGKIKIVQQSSGIVDKAVDLFTSSKKAQEFFDEKTEETVYETSKVVLDSKKENVIRDSEKSLAHVINLNSDHNIKVKLDKDFVNFKIVDKK